MVSLFLPHTLSFHERKQDERSSSPPPAPQIGQRRSLTLTDLPKRASTTSLFIGPTPPLTPNAAAEEFFNQFATEAQRRHFAKPGDPRSLVRSDAEVPEWGLGQVYHQPRSRAGPLPSGSILDFAKVHEELQQRKQRDAKKKLRSPPPSRASRAPSRERGYAFSKYLLLLPPPYTSQSTLTIPFAGMRTRLGP